MIVGVLAAASPVMAATPVALAIVNAEPARALRCTALLAHFITLPETAIAPGATAVLALVRSRDGTLAVADGAQRLVVEAVHCGADDAWSATWAALPLGRARAAARLTLHCRIARRLICTPGGTP